MSTMDRIKVLVILTAAAFLATGCEKPDANYTPEQRAAAADHRVAAFMSVCKELGIEATMIGSVGPGYYGMFNGAIVDPGIHAQFIIRGSPKDQLMADRAWSVLQKGGTAADAVEAAREVVMVPDSQPSHED